jgi:hypothetical protein
LWQYVHKIPFLSLFAIHANFNVPFCHEDFGCWVRFRKRVDDLQQALLDLINCTLWCSFSVVLLTDASTSPFLSLSQNERPSIDLKAFDLCRIAVIGNIFNCCGGLSFMSSHITIHACLMQTFLHPPWQNAQ